MLDIGRLSEIQDPTQRMLAITRWYLSSWHLKPPVFICQLQLPYSTDWGLTSFLVRVSKNHTTQFWVRYITVNGNMAIPIWEQPTTSQNKCHITPRFLPFISWTESGIGAWMCRFDQKANFWAILQLQSWRERPIFTFWTTVQFLFCYMYCLNYGTIFVLSYVLFALKLPHWDFNQHLRPLYHASDGRDCLGFHECSVMVGQIPNPWWLCVNLKSGCLYAMLLKRQSWKARTNSQIHRQEKFTKSPFLHTMCEEFLSELWEWRLGDWFSLRLSYLPPKCCTFWGLQRRCYCILWASKHVSDFIWLQFLITMLCGAIRLSWFPWLLQTGLSMELSFKNRYNSFTVAL